MTSSTLLPPRWKVTITQNGTTFTVTTFSPSQDALRAALWKQYPHAERIHFVADDT